MSVLPNRPDWQRLDKALAELLELEVGKRRASIERQFADRPDLAQHLRKLLHLSDAPGVLDAFEPTMELGHFPDATPIISGSILGNWTLLQPIGSGGMAEVWLAERASGGATQRAAIKLMAGGFSRPDLQTRFDRERRILARLSDARIARYYDGGLAMDGRPWLAMEYIAGQQIDDYCDHHDLDLQARLRLLREVMGAVAHAHRALIVHRDIKPANVLVSADGQLKLLDFGIAKAVVDSECDVDLTQTQSRVLTPGYASPEQLRGEPVGTATDVYQLGLLLFELICGQRPFARHTDNATAMQKAIVESDPERPSELLARRRKAGDRTRIATREVRGDLDRIVLLALRKEPERRYPSVDAFERDIAAWMDGKPVSARGDAPGYRLRKFMGRHRMAAAAIGAALLVLLISSAALVVQNAQVRAQRDVARNEAAKSAAVRDFLVGLMTEADPGHTQGDKIPIGQILESGRQRIGKDLQGQPRIRAEMLHTLGSVYHALGNYSQARQLVTESVALRRQWADAPAELSRSLTELAGIERDDSQLDKAVALAHEAISKAGSDIHARALAENELGVDLLMRDKDMHAARNALGNALTDYALWPTPDPVRSAIARGNLAVIDYRAGDLDAAAAGYRQALDVLSPKLGDRHPEVTGLLYNLARLEEQRGQYDPAATLLERVIAAESSVLGEDSADVAIDRTRLAYVEHRRGNLDAAAGGFALALTKLRVRLPADHKRIAENLMGFAETLVDQKEPAAAATHIAEALRILQKHFPIDDWRVAEAMRIQARAWVAQGDRDKARAQLERIGPILLKRPPPYPERYRATLAEI